MTQHHQTPPALKPLPRLAKIFLVLAIAVFHSSSQRTMINFKARKQIAQGWNLQGQDGWEPNRTTSSPVFGCGVCDSNAQRHIQNSEPDAPVTCNFMSVMIPFSGVSWPNDLFRWVQCRSIVANHLQHFMFADVNMSQYIAGEYTSWCFTAVYLYNLQSLNTFQRHVSLCNDAILSFRFMMLTMLTVLSLCSLFGVRHSEANSFAFRCLWSANGDGESEIYQSRFLASPQICSGHSFLYYVHATHRYLLEILNATMLDSALAVLDGSIVQCLEVARYQISADDVGTDISVEALS